MGLRGGIHLGKGGPADQVVGHQPAQFAAVGQCVTDHHREGRGAVEHLGIAQRRQGGRIGVVDALPQAQLAHQRRRALRHGNFAAIEGRVFQRLARLLLDQADGQSRICQRARQAQAGRAGSTDEKIEIHAQSPEKSKGVSAHAGTARTRA